MLDTLPQDVQDEARRMAQDNERRLLKSAEHIRLRLLQAAAHDTGDPIGAMRQELQDMRYLHERWLADLRKEREKRRTP